MMTAKVGVPGSSDLTSAERAARSWGAEGQSQTRGSSARLYAATLGLPASGATCATTQSSDLSHVQVVLA